MFKEDVLKEMWMTADALDKNIYIYIKLNEFALILQSTNRLNGLQDIPKL